MGVTMKGHAAFLSPQLCKSGPNSVLIMQQAGEELHPARAVLGHVAPGCGQIGAFGRKNRAGVAGDPARAREVRWPGRDFGLALGRKFVEPADLPIAKSMPDRQGIEHGQGAGAHIAQLQIGVNLPPGQIGQGSFQVINFVVDIGKNSIKGHDITSVDQSGHSIK